MTGLAEQAPWYNSGNYILGVPNYFLSGFQACSTEQKLIPNTIIRAENM